MKTWTEWASKYRPIKNPFGGPDEYIFDWSDEEIAFMKKYKTGNIWTLVDGEGTSLLILPGIHYVNRLGYFVTEEKWTDENDVYEM